MYYIRSDGVRGLEPKLINMSYLKTWKISCNICMYINALVGCLLDPLAKCPIIINTEFFRAVKRA